MPRPRSRSSNRRRRSPSDSTKSDLATMSRLGRGQSLIALGEVARGVAYLDDAMLAVTSGEAGPVVTGIVYCASIEAFHRIYDLRRAQGWTEALTRWRSRASRTSSRSAAAASSIARSSCGSTGTGRRRRRRSGWPRQRCSVRRRSRPPARRSTSRPSWHRLGGELDAAETAYRQAAGWGRRPEPGLALLRLAQGRAPGRAGDAEAGDRRDPERARPGAPARGPGEVAIAADDLGDRARRRGRAGAPRGCRGERRSWRRSPRARTARPAWPAASRWPP